MLLNLPDFDLGHDASKRLQVYKALLLKWQKSINLISTNTVSEVDTRHFADSLQLCGFVSRETNILDIGSGAGFPGLVISIATGSKVTLVESDSRKCEFMRTVSRETLSNSNILNIRIEKADLETPDVITARALADLSTLLAITEKWWSVNRKIVLLFLKGENAENEILEAKQRFKLDVEQYRSTTSQKGRILRLTDIARIQ